MCHDKPIPTIRGQILYNHCSRAISSNLLQKFLVRVWLKTIKQFLYSNYLLRIKIKSSILIATNAKRRYIQNFLHLHFETVRMVLKKLWLLQTHYTRTIKTLLTKPALRVIILIITLLQKKNSKKTIHHFLIFLFQTFLCVSVAYHCRFVVFVASKSIMSEQKSEIEIFSSTI